MPIDAPALVPIKVCPVAFEAAVVLEERKAPAPSPPKVFALFKTLKLGSPPPVPATSGTKIISPEAFTDKTLLFDAVVVDPEFKLAKRTPLLPMVKGTPEAVVIGLGTPALAGTRIISPVPLTLRAKLFDAEGVEAEVRFANLTPLLPIVKGTPEPVVIGFGKADSEGTRIKSPVAFTLSPKLLAVEGVEAEVRFANLTPLFPIVKGTPEPVVIGFGKLPSAGTRIILPVASTPRAKPFEVAGVEAEVRFAIFTPLFPIVKGIPVGVVIEF